jgi:alpha-galactosidase
MAKAVRISVIGAGSGVFSLGLVKDLCLTPNLAGSTVSFMDIDADRLDTVHKLAERYAQELGASMRFEKTTDRAASLRDADFVINTASAKSHHSQRRVREMTAEHGYYYGGVELGGDAPNFNLMLSVAADMQTICPNAWLIQSGNPVFEGTTLMNRLFDLKIIGLCHGHYGYLEVARVLGLDPKRVTWEAPGLNHHIWLTKFLYDGQDAYPLLNQWIEREGETYWRTHVAERTHDIQMSRGTIHMYEMFGLMPIGDTPRTNQTSTRWWYHTDLATKKHWFGDTFGGPDTEIARPFYVANLEKRLRAMHDAANDPTAKVADAFGREHTREQQVPIINALANNVEGRFQVNVPNRGVIDGIPDDVVAEFQALIDATGVHPIKPSPLPQKIMLQDILPTWIQMEQDLLAYQSKDRGMLLYQALNSAQTRGYDQAVSVLQEFLAIEGNEAYRERYQGFDGADARWRAPRGQEAGVSGAD